MKYFAYAFALLASLFATPVMAADWHLSATNVEGQANLVALHLTLNAGDDRFNVVEGNITVSGKDVRVLETSVGTSVASFWPETPAVIGNNVRFAFMTPGGVTGNGLPVLTVIASMPADSQLVVSAHDSAAYKHNGEGTRVPIPTATLTLDKQPSQSKSESITDKRAPEPFTPTVEQEPLINKQPILFFNAQDKESGVDHYDLLVSAVALSEAELAASKDWVRIENPYTLPTHIVASHVYIRAIDKGGNVRMSHVELPTLPTTTRLLWPFAIAVVVTTILAAFVALSKAPTEPKHRPPKGIA